MKELVKPLHEQNSRLKTNIHEMNFKIEDHFEKLMIYFSEEQQFKSRTSELDYTMEIIKEKIEDQIQTIESLREQLKNSQQDNEFQQQLLEEKDQEFLNLKMQHESEKMEIINQYENQIRDIKLINQNLQLQIGDYEKQIQYQDNNIEKVIESRMVDRLKDMVKLSKQIEELKEQMINQENLHQVEIAKLIFQYEKDKKYLKDELEQQEIRIETKYRRAHQENSFTNDQIANLQKSNKSLKVQIDTYEKQINQLKSQKMTIQQDLNREKKERAMDNKQHKETEQIITTFKDKEERFNRSIQRLEDQILKNQKENELKLLEKNVRIQEQIDNIQQLEKSLNQIQQQLINQKTGYEEQLIIQKVKFYKQLGQPIDNIDKQFITHDFEQQYDDPVNRDYVFNLEKNQINYQQQLKSYYDQIKQLKQDLIVQKEEQQNKYQLELANYKQIVQKAQQAINRQQEETLNKIYEENNEKIQNLQDQHNYQIDQMKLSYISLQQSLSEANQDIMSKLQEIESIKQDNVEKQYKLLQEIKQYESKLERQASDNEKYRIYNIQENQKQLQSLQLQIDEKIQQITLLEAQIHKFSSQQQARLHEIQDLKQQLHNYKKALELTNQENKKQSDQNRILMERLRLLQLEVDNSKNIYNIFRQTRQSTDRDEQTNSFRFLQSEQKSRNKSQLLQITKSTSQSLHRTLNIRQKS
ncbi:hypothetical protein pb186bvf_004809 [Paramecium bursaria]